MKRWRKKKGRAKCKYLKKKKVNVKKNYRKIGNKKKYIYIYIYIDVKTDKNEYVKSIIYLYIYFCKKNSNK